MHAYIQTYTHTHTQTHTNNTLANKLANTSRTQWTGTMPEVCVQGFLFWPKKHHPRKVPAGLFPISLSKIRIRTSSQWRRPKIPLL